MRVKSAFFGGKDAPLSPLRIRCILHVFNIQATRKIVVKERKAGLSTRPCSLATLNKMFQFKTPGLYLPWHTR